MNPTMYLNDDVLFHVLSYMDTLSLCEFQKVNSKTYVLIFRVFNENMSRICNGPIKGQTELNRCILQAKESYDAVIRVIDKPTPSLDSMHQVLQVISDHQKSFCQTIENAGVPSPKRPLTCSDLRKYILAIARADWNLQRCWPLFRHFFSSPTASASADLIRPFMDKYKHYSEAKRSLALHGRMHHILRNKVFVSPINLSQIPNEINLFSNLRTLTITGHSLVALYPRQFAGLTHLEELSMSENQLQTLPEDALRGLKKLNRLNLEKNGLIELPENLFRDQGELLCLNLGDNTLEKIPEALLTPLGKLATLMLGVNRLRELAPKQFTSQKQLQELDLGENCLTELPPEVFKPLASLARLDLSDNKLKKLGGAFLHNKCLTKVDLVGNRLIESPESFFRLVHSEIVFDSELEERDIDFFSSEEDSMDAEEVCESLELEYRTSELSRRGMELMAKLREDGILHFNISGWLAWTQRDKEQLGQTEAIFIKYMRQLLDTQKTTKVSRHMLECVEVIPSLDRTWGALKQCLETVARCLEECGAHESIKSLELPVWDACKMFFREADNRSCSIRSLMEMVMAVALSEKREQKVDAAPSLKPQRRRAITI